MFRPVARLLVTLLSLAAASVCASAGGWTDVVVGKVEEASYRHWLDDVLFARGGDDRGFGVDHDAARDAILAQFRSFGLDARLEAFTWSGSTYHNVVATLPGRLRGDDVYILGAHYDSKSNPGADDNASGVGAVLEAARVMSQTAFAGTIIFAAFDREEQGLVGSQAYVAAHAGQNVRGMVSLDMIGYNPAGANHDKAAVYGRAASGPIRQAVRDAVGMYGGLTAVEYGQLDASDHAPFEWAGYQGCLLTEHEAFGNPYYHALDDAVETGFIDYAYAAKMTRSAVGWCSSSAGALVPGDATSDGRVDYADLGILALSYRGPADWAGGDFTGDGAVDYLDLGVLAGNYRTVVTGEVALPEPSTGAILLAAWALVRRRHGHANSNGRVSVAPVSLV